MAPAFLFILAFYWHSYLTFFMGGVFSDNTYNFVAMSRLLPYFFYGKGKKAGVDAVSNQIGMAHTNIAYSHWLNAVYI
jgi:hypothetical protein